MTPAETHAEPTPDGNRPPYWEAGLIAAAVALLAAGLFWRGRPAPAYVGDAACKSCHPGPFAAHARSGHARTLRRVDATPLPKALDGVAAADPELPGVSWAYAARGGGLTVERRADPAVERFVLEYAFGSGRHATTFVSLTDRDPEEPRSVEHRLTVFAHETLPGLTPGHSLKNPSEGNTPSGRRLSSWNTRKCFECHTTTLPGPGADAFDAAALVPNVGCERCHGPGRDHVAAARGGESGDRLALPLRPGRASAAAELNACGQCHRLPKTVTDGGGVIRPDDPGLVRHQPVGLMQSACYTRGGRTLTCTTCHDPHAPASTDLVAYEAVCKTCHEGPSRTRCATAATTGCVGCHMPRRDVTHGMRMTDHWIRARPANATPAR